MFVLYYQAPLNLFEFHLTSLQPPHQFDVPMVTTKHKISSCKDVLINYEKPRTVKKTQTLTNDLNMGSRIN